MTSKLAKRLADDLVQVGKSLGFKTTRENPVLKNSAHCVDLLWKLPMPKGGPFPVVNVAVIEIQYSNSPLSISHNILKSEPTLHPAFHFVISYNKLTNDYKENVLKTTFPKAGLVVVDGEDNVRKLNLWITRFLTIPRDEQTLIMTGREISKLVEQRIQDDENTVSQAIQSTFENDIKNVFLPPKLSDLLSSTIELGNVGTDRKLIDEVYNAFIKYVQQKLEEAKVDYIEIPTYSLFQQYLIEDDFKNMPIELGYALEIRADNVFLRDRNNYPYEVRVNNGNACVDSQAGTVCTRPLEVKDIYDFISSASESIKRKLCAYEITDADKEKIVSIINTLEKQ